MKKVFVLILLLALAFPVLAQSADEYKFTLVPRRPVTLPANSAGYLLNDGSGGLSWGAVDLSPYVEKDGTTELTADWNVGAFDLTCVDMNATNFKLSGVGTLTSTLGNVSLTTALTAASGDEVGFYLPVTVNKAAGNYTAFKVNVTEISAPGNSDYLMVLQVGSVDKFSITNSGIGTFGSACVSESFRTAVNNTTVTLQNMSFATAGKFAVEMATGTFSATSGANGGVAIKPTYNQTSGTSANTDLLISRTSTATGSGEQLFLDCRDNTVSKAKIYDTGAITSTMINNADSDTDEVDSVVFAGGYGMVIAASVTDGTSAVWKLKGTVFEAIEVDADWTATKDNASSYNVYIESGAIKLQNKVGENKAVKLGYFGI